MDNEGTGKLAWTYLLPDGYSAADEVKWIPGDYMTPVVGTSTIKSDDGSVLIESMSGLQLCYSHSPAGSTGVDPPQSVTDFLLASWKKEHPGLEFSVVDKKDSEVPDATQSGTGFHMYANEGVVELEYVKDGTTFHVKTHARIDVMGTNPAPTAIGGTIDEGGWVINYNYTVTAPKDKFEDAMKTFGIVMSSSRTDPHFFNTIMQARDIIQKNFYARQREIGKISEIISQTNDEMLDSMNQTYKASEEAGEHEVTNFDDYIRGIDRYNDEDNTEVSLPSGYEHAWSDGNGSYIVSDDHLYNPNVTEKNGTWHEMEKKQ
jgi:hypothetical protein